MAKLSGIIEEILSFPTVFDYPETDHPFMEKFTIVKVVTQVASFVGKRCTICQPEEN